MNYRYQLAWSAALRAAPLALAIALGLAGPAHAAAELPVFGSATGAMPTITVQGDTLTLSQPDPSDTWVDWTSFNIGPGGTVNFLQTAGNATSASHRVTGGTGSTIAGSLSMQGRQVLADARGIVVDTTGVVAGDHLILAGMAMSPAASGVRAAYDFDAGGSPAGVVNRGAIAGSAGGSMVLLGSSVRNEGSIATTTGNIQIVAASHVLDAGPVATDFTHTVPALGGYVPLHAANGGQPAIENAGTIDNPGGQIHLVARADPGLFGTLIRNTGTISADYVQYGSIGTVVLDARGGDIDSSGTIRVSGGRVGLISDANVIMTGTIDATGTPYASGYLQIGPGYLDQTAPTPRVAYVGDHAAIRTFADWPSTDDTFGGTIEISARDALHFGGTLDAHGTGGLLVLSSDGYLEADARIDLGPHKLRDSGGQLDIESGNAMVVTDHVMARVQADGTYTAGGPSQVGAAMLTGADADVLLKSQSNILLDADMAFTGPGIEFEARSGGAIELAAGRSFTFGANGISHVTMTAAGAVDIDAGSRIGLAEPKGYDSLTVTGSEVNVGGEIHAGGFTATARQGAFTQNAGAISAESVKITAPGSVYLGQDNRISSLTVSTGGDLVLRALDPISVSGSVAGTAVIDASSDFSAGSTDFKGLVTVNARDAGFSNQSPLTFGRVRANNLNASTYTGDLTMTDAVDLTGGGTLTSRGSIIQAGGPFSGGAYVRFSASGDLTLDNPSNHFGGNLEVAGRTVRVANDGDISLVGASGGNLWISTGGASGKVTLLGEIHGTSTFIDGSLTMGQAYYVRDEAVTGNLTTTGSLSVIGEHGYLFNSDFSVGGDFTQAVASPTGGTTYASVLNGNTQVHGSTHLVAGGLVVGDSTHNGATLTSNVSVDAGAILSGTGHVVGDVTVAKDGRIAPGDGSQYPQGNGFGTLDVNGSVALNGGGLAIKLGAPGADAQTSGESDRLHVTGNVLVDNAVIDLKNGGGMAPGLYTVLDYLGTYTALNGGFHLGKVPAGSAIQLLDRTELKRVDIIDSTSVPVTFWNGDGLASASRYGGGSGTWTARNASWTDATAAWHGPLTTSGFAVFAGARGDIRVDEVDGWLRTSGMQFATDGYTLSGDPVRLLASGTLAPVIRVGDGTSAGKGYRATVNSVLTGAAGLVKADSGTLVLTAANTYTGGTTVSGGALEVSQDAALGDGSGALTLDGGSLRVVGNTFNATRRAIALGANGGGLDIADAGNSFTLTQSLGGTGGLTKSGAGTLALRGGNTYSGGTVVAAGSLIGDTTSLQGNIVDNAALVFDQPMDGRYTGTLTGSGTLAKRGAGTLVFDGNGTFTGTTTIHAGGLQVGSASTPAAYLGGNVQLEAGASLGGHGTIGGSLVSHGTVAPGGSIGTLTVHGDAMLASDSILYIDTAPDGASRLAVDGHATIDGARLVVDAQGKDWIASNHYDLLTATGGITGQFASVNTNFAFLNSIIAYNASGTVSLDLQRNAVSFLDAASTRNQRAVAAAADTLGSGHDVYDRLVTMDEGSARAAFTALAGDLHASVQSAVVDDQRQVRDAVTRRLTDADEGRQGARGDDGHGVTAWVSVLGRDADYDGNANAGKIDGSSSGALLGIDVAVDGDARLGVLVGHGKQSLHERSLDGSADVRSNPFGLYGDIAFDALALRGGVVHASHDIDTTRRVTLGATTSSLKAHRDADTTQAFAELGYAFEPTTRARVEPFVQVATVRWSGDDATERGGPGALAIDDRDAHVTSGKLGLHAALATDAAHAVGWQATLAWQHASGDTTPSSRLRFAEGGAGFDVTGVPLARNAATVDVGLTFRVTPAVHLDASYTGQYASGLTDHGGRLGLGVDF